MTVGVVTSFTYNDREYDVPTSLDERKRFVTDLIAKLEALDGVEAVFNAGTSQTWDGVRLEIALEVTEQAGVERLASTPRSLSPRIRNALSEFVPVSSHEILATPTPVNADENIYEDALYIAEIRLY